MYIKIIVVYLLIHSHQKKIKMEKTQRELTYNEWVKEYKVSSSYVEPTNYYQGNPGSGFEPMVMETKLQRFFRLLGF